MRGRPWGSPSPRTPLTVPATTVPARDRQGTGVEADGIMTARTAHSSEPAQVGPPAPVMAPYRCKPTVAWRGSPAVATGRSGWKLAGCGRTPGPGRGGCLSEGGHALRAPLHAEAGESHRSFHFPIAPVSSPGRQCLRAPAAAPVERRLASRQSETSFRLGLRALRTASRSATGCSVSWRPAGVGWVSGCASGSTAGLVRGRHLSAVCSPRSRRSGSPGPAQW
jgi:hypothetical protein